VKTWRPRPRSPASSKNWRAKGSSPVPAFRRLPAFAAGRRRLAFEEHDSTWKRRYRSGSTGGFVATVAPARTGGSLRSRASESPLGHRRRRRSATRPVFPVAREGFGDKPADQRDPARSAAAMKCRWRAARPPFAEHDSTLLRLMRKHRGNPAPGAHRPPAAFDAHSQTMARCATAFREQFLAALGIPFLFKEACRSKPSEQIRGGLLAEITWGRLAPIAWPATWPERDSTSWQLVWRA